MSPSPCRGFEGFVGGLPVGACTDTLYFFLYFFLVPIQSHTAPPRPPLPRPQLIGSLYGWAAGVIISPSGRRVLVVSPLQI